MIDEPQSQADAAEPTEFVLALRCVLDYLAVEDEPRPADVIIALGSDSAEVAIHAAHLYNDGLAPLILFSGGKGRMTGKVKTTEAAFFRRTAIKCGVPDSVTLMERASTNALENIVNSRDAMIKLVVNVGQVIIMTQPVLQRRAWATARHQWTGPEFINCPPLWRHELVSGFTAQRKRLAELAIGEIRRLVEYADKGDIEPQDIPSRVLVARDLLLATHGIRGDT